MKPIQDIIKSVEKFYGIPEGVIYDKCRTATVAEARHIAVYLSREMTNFSLSEISDVFHRDHTTILNSIRRVSGNEKLIKKSLGALRFIEGVYS